MRTLAIVAVVLGLARPARADTAIGVFVGEPTGLDIKLGLQQRGALDILIGATGLGNGRISYGHLTDLYTLTVARGDSVNVPLRLGLGGWVAGITEDVTAVGARVPFEIALKFRRTPLEIYGEIAFVLRLIEDVDSDIDGGIGLRVYF
jgi:hypothetical protein